MNVLVTGASGQLGSEIKELIKNFTFNTENYDFYFTISQELDITDFDKVREYIEDNQIKIIINCAAYTAVDKAETEQELSNKINHLAVKNLAMLSNEFELKLIHVSTDYIFDGKNYKPYTEEDVPNPQNVYGKSKLDGEKAIQEINPNNSIIIRTSWVYSSFGNNFVKTMLRLGNERDKLGVIYDQIGTPTYARDLAKVILDIIPKIQNSRLSIYNYSNEGAISWYDFAKEIMKMAKLDCNIKPIETNEYLALNADAPLPKGKVGRPTPALRPHYSLLNKSKIKKDFDIIIPYWKDSLDECLRKIGERK